ncbi:translocation/assembly module TamB domain-containing protein [Sphingomicrobium marinum]|uniref:translocation/assembly module TamB domain-containing protein n=1 Tax=Sphingomicrobium marinum TaxID=1227950 RepID=UPI002240B295|nr:translocation/assembly module TamB domain-containing protein [Sphingomicrobium marinum]
MAEGDVTQAPTKRKKPWWKRLLKELAVLLVLLAGLVALVLIGINTSPGKRFLADQINGYTLPSGISVKIGRIEGSIYDEAVLKNVEVHDLEGAFLTSPEIRLDWAPFAWLYNTLHIDEVTAETLTLERLPVTRPSEDDGPLLPGFDIYIGALEVEQLVIGEAVTGARQVGSVRGSADIRSGIAKVDLQAALDGGDRLALRLDSEPDADKLDLGARVVSPESGVIAKMLGLPDAAELTVTGEGSWAEWDGEAKATLGEVQLADLDLMARDGTYTIAGTLRPARLVQGTLRELLAGTQTVRATGTFEERVANGEVRLDGPSLEVVLRGGVDLAANRFDDLAVAAELKRPSALLPTLGGQPVRLAASLNGAMDGFAYTYRLRSAATQIDAYRLIGWQADGRGNWGPPPRRVPLTLTAQAITGGGALVDDVLRDVRLQALLLVAHENIRADDARLTSRGLNALIDLSLDLRTGDLDVAVDGQLRNFELEGLGQFDVDADLNIRRTGAGTTVSGPVVVRTKRLDNSFFAGLTGGLPAIRTDLVFGPDGIARLNNLRVTSPDLNLAGSGYRRRDGTFYIEASGEQATYGPVEVTIDGDISRPEVSLQLASPQPALGLSDVSVTLLPTADGFDFVAAGGSRFGPFTTNGEILLPPGGTALIDIAALTVAGSTGQGRLAIVPGGFDGQLRLAGGEIGGILTFDVVNEDAQRIAMDLTLDGADFPGPPAMRFASGEVAAVMILREGSISIQGGLVAQRATIAGMDLRRLEANGRLVNGRGSASVTMRGTRASGFNFAGQADIAPDRIILSGEGELDRERLALSRAEFLLIDGEWRLDGANLRYGDGGVRFSGALGPNPRVNATLDKLPLKLLDLINPDMELSGTASGRLDLALGNARRGTFDLEVLGLSRSGLVLASRPIDVALAGRLDPQELGIRAVFRSDGKRVGRAQARFAPIGGGDLVNALRRAPMVAQVRYAGPSDALWRLSGFELFDLSGPMEAAIDMRGSLNAPRIAGAVRLDGARLESPVTGMVVRGVQAQGRFDGSRLSISSFSGSTRDDGRISGSGAIIVGGDAGLAFDMNFDTQNAWLLERDDLAAQVSGPIRIRSTAVADGGTISGNLRLVEGSYTLGTAGTVAAVPSIDVIERNGSEEEIITRAQLSPWRLDMSVAGEPLLVRGLGIDSRWRTDLQVGGTVLSPAVRGTANLIRGDYRFAGTQFELTEGVIRFVGNSPPNPRLNIEAVSEVQGLTATVSVTGTGLAPQIAFSSIPALPQDELLARLLFGTSVTNLSAAEVVQLGAAVASLQGGGGGFNPINSVRDALGLDRLRIMPADVATGAKTSVAAGKYVTKKLFVEVITDGQGYTATLAEYQIFGWLSLLATVSSIGREGVAVQISRDY